MLTIIGQCDRHQMHYDITDKNNNRCFEGRFLARRSMQHLVEFNLSIKTEIVYLIFVCILK
jgi:hypothetical protein